MEHLDEGQLRAHLDGALPEEASDHVRRHLAVCGQCAREAATLQARGARVRAWLARLDAQEQPQPASHKVARQRLEGYRPKEERAMLQRLFGRRYRAGWAIAALVAAVAVAFSLAPVRALAGDLLALFRVQRLKFVQVDGPPFPDAQTLDAAARKLEALMQDRVSIRSDGEPQAVDEATARSASGFPVRLPAALGGGPQLTLRPGLHAAMQIDLAQIRALLSELGYSGAHLPDSLDGAEISVDFSPMLVAAYGPCERTDAQAGCTVLVQVPSPEVSVPPELDVDQLGQAYLQVLGMSADEAARFSQRVDWTTTLVVSLPKSRDLDCRDVRVDGVDGVLVRPRQATGGQQRYLLVWLKDGIVYGLAGAGTEEDALRIAGSLR